MILSAQSIRKRRPVEPDVAEKTCSKCEQTLPATFEFFYRHPSGKFGLTPRCKPCTNEDNKASAQKRKEQDPERFRKQALKRQKAHYLRDIEASRKEARENAAKARLDPAKREKINMRKRGGGAKLTPEAFDQMLKEQAGKCAICQTDEPSNKKGSAGWNVDHCHKTKSVRFILCNDCNRGLGAFRDKPDLLRRAAKMLECISLEAT